MAARIRRSIVITAVAVVAVTGGGIAAVRAGADALEPGDGSRVTTAPASTGWAGLTLDNRSALPLTLHRVRIDADTSHNARIEEAFVVPGSYGASISDGRLAPESQQRPLDGFVLPAHSTGTSSIVFRFTSVDRGHNAQVGGERLQYSALGMDHDAALDDEYCLGLRAGSACLFDDPQG